MKSQLKRLGASVLAAFTSPTAVKAEVSLGTVAVVRLALLLGAGTETVNLVKGLVQAVTG